MSFSTASLTRHGDGRRVRDVIRADAIPGHTDVIPKIPLQDVVNPQLCAVVEHPDPVRDLDGGVVLVPEDLRGGGPAGVAPEDQGVVGGDVDVLFRGLKKKEKSNDVEGGRWDAN